MSGISARTPTHLAMKEVGKAPAGKSGCVSLRLGSVGCQAALQCYVRVLSGVLLVLSLLALQPTTAFAHPEVLRSDPSAGGIVDAAPPVVTITFTEPVESRLLDITVVSESGSRIDLGDARRLDDARQVQVGLGGASQGGYVVRWATFDNTTGDTTPIGTAATTTDRQVKAPAGLPSPPGAIVKVQVAADDPGHPSWATPVDAYFRRGATGWTLVGLERMPVQ